MTTERRYIVQMADDTEISTYARDEQDAKAKACDMRLAAMRIYPDVRARFANNIHASTLAIGARRA